MDISGESQRDVTHSIVKTRLDVQGGEVPNGRKTGLESDLGKVGEAKSPDYCGSCYGGLPPEGGCCQTCEDVRQAYIKNGWSFANPDAVEQVRTVYH
jgi:endoplasmic reticulum-Golgi intermediate compartment protein 3